MKTAEVSIEPPADLVTEVRNLKAHFPFRVCWGAFDSSDPSKRETGANYDRRKFNRALRQPNWVGFTI